MTSLGGRPPIRDRFSKLPVSRQRKEQLRLAAKGICVGCRKKRIVKRERCQACNEKLDGQHRKAMQETPRPFGARHK